MLLFRWVLVNPSYLERMRDTGRRTNTIVALDKVAIVSRLFAMIGQLSDKFDVSLSSMRISWQEISQIGYNSDKDSDSGTKCETFHPKQSSTVFANLG
ncbi:hypothetical protein PUN28_008793 [Cardiocondyla obscurior]|uniref:Uncharacterized protein n=1 Tax=Cardiocondyla obscurior TaxID=286306 RepID=A0AAW2FS97_9HYME